MILLLRRALMGLGMRRAPNQSIQELTRSLALIVDREALESSISARLLELFDPESLVIFTSEAEAPFFTPSFSTGVPAEALERAKFSRTGRLCRWLLVNETTLVVERQGAVLSYLDDSEQALIGELGADLCSPMICQGQLMGLIVLGWDGRAPRLGRGQLELLELVANQASLAFQNAELYKAQRERLDRLHRAERLAAAGELAAAVAHEIRNPLTAIRSTMQYVVGDLNERPDKQELVRELISEVDRIDGTITRLLSLTRANPAREDDVDLVSVVENSVQLVRARAVEQKVAVRWESPTGDYEIRGDAQQLKQVFLNLMLNAIQAMPDGGVLQVVAARRPAGTSAPAGGTVEVRVQDSGIGISEEKIGRVFDPFFTTKTDGTGLGLTISHAIVEDHGGELRFQSRPGQGTVVSVVLPKK